MGEQHFVQNIGNLIYNGDRKLLVKVLVESMICYGYEVRILKREVQRRW